MRRRNVNAYLEFWILRKEVKFFRCFANVIAGEGDYQVLRFGNRDENIRVNPADTWVIPSEQDLNPGAAGTPRADRHAHGQGGCAAGAGKNGVFTHGISGVQERGRINREAHLGNHLRRLHGIGADKGGGAVHKKHLR